MNAGEEGAKLVRKGAKASEKAAFKPLVPISHLVKLSLPDIFYFHGTPRER